jgi:hypothetical protein
MRFWRDVGEAIMDAFWEQSVVDEIWWRQTVPAMGMDPFKFERVTS